MQQPLRLLIVDDNDFETRLLSAALHSAFSAISVCCETNPAAAVDLAGGWEADCVLIDYNMPQQDGLSLGRILREKFPHLALILMTSVGDEMLAAEAMRNGFSDYIPKSKITQESAKRIVQRAIEAAKQGRVIQEQADELQHFAYALSHDFKQPIRQIQTFADLLIDEVNSDGPPDVISRYLTYMRDASRRLGNLVDVMSQYTLLSRPPELSVVDVRIVVENVCANLDIFIAERNASVTCEGDLAVRGNEALLSQALQNLIVNGLRYNVSAAPRISINLDRDAVGKCFIRVRDNGIGIDERFCSEIFKPLVRLHTVSEYPGTGLGLTITRKALLAQGGAISCSSTPGAGSEFVIEMWLGKMGKVGSTLVADANHSAGAVV